MASASTTISQSGIQLIEVRIRNFRSLKKVNVTLDRLTILIGENNSGKTSFLEALYTAIGLGRRNILIDDIYLAIGECKPPKERIVTIDILIRPVDEQSNIIDFFPEDSFWLTLWGNGISQDTKDNDFIAVRTQAKWDDVRCEYVTERNFLKDWQDDPHQWQNSKVQESPGFISFKQIEPFALYLMDAKRDIQDEMYDKTSFWNRLVSNLDLTDDQVERVENGLGELNQQITDSSQVLQHIKNYLNKLNETISCDQSGIFINPIPRYVRNLSRGADINFATRGSQTFPLSRHGMGTRSLAVLLTFQAFMAWQQENTENESIHPLLALEEPEAHLHPQAQRALLEQIKCISGQLIVSTHSPYITSQASIANFRHFRKDRADTLVTQVDTSLLSKEDLRKIDRMVMNTRGDLLYARAVILFEGETEEQALPKFAEKYWELQPNALGISLIGVSGCGNYLPFLRLVSSFGIPWYIFSDGETNTINKVKTALAKINIPDPSQETNIVFLPEEQNFESYLIAEGYSDEIQVMLNNYHEDPNYINTYKKQHDHERDKNGNLKDYQSEDGDKRAIIDILAGGKTKYGLRIAEAITNSLDEKRKFPTKIRELFEQISNKLDITQVISTL